MNDPMQEDGDGYSGFTRSEGKGLIIGDFSVFYNDPDFFARAMGNEGLSACGFVTGCQTMILNSKGK